MSISTSVGSEQARWLKTRYEEAPTEGPALKRVKYQTLKDEMESQFPDRLFNTEMVSGFIKEAFPHTFTKRVGQLRHTHVVGLKLIDVDVQVQGANSTPSEETEALMRRIEQLEERIHQRDEENASLKKKCSDLQEYSLTRLVDELSHLTSQRNAMYHGPNTVQNFFDFSIDALRSECQEQAPSVLKLLKELGGINRFQPEKSTSVQLKALMALCMLVKCRSTKVLGVQLLITFMLIARSASRQTITTLNHAGVCDSYSTAWKYLRDLTMQSGYTEAIRSGHWLWVYDNLNINQRVRHEREDRHSKMLNITSRLALRVQNLPPWEVNWSDHAPQRSKDSLTTVDFKPTEEDAGELKKRAVNYVMRFLVNELPCLQDLRPFLPKDAQVSKVQKVEVVPMTVLFKDEKYIADTIDILTQLMADATLTGDPQVVVGDQLTCKNIRSSKMWRQSEVEQKHRLAWACESPGDFHFLWECLRVIYSIFWGTPSQAGSLSNLREIVRRTRVDKAVKVFNVGDEFLVHSFRSHLTASILTELKIKEVTDYIQHARTQKWLVDTATSIVSHVLMPKKSQDPVYHLHTSFLHLAYLYVDLREAIRWENGPQVIRHWKWWLPRFLATGCKNYASECVHLISNLQAIFPKHIAYIVANNRTVNTKGKPGHGKPIDQHLEHYNLVFKQTVRSAGANLTAKHLEEVSMSVLFLMEAAQKADRAFDVPVPSSAHTVHDSSKDISAMAKHLHEKTVTVESSERQSPPFVDPTDNGWKKLTRTWLKETMERTSIEDSELMGDVSDCSFDVEYSLADVI